MNVIEKSEQISKFLAELKFAEAQLLALNGIRESLKRPDIKDTLKLDLTLYHSADRIAFARIAVPSLVLDLEEVELYWVGRRQFLRDQLRAQLRSSVEE